ncbi:DUF4091 domain-containing protein [Flavihumibacter sp. UBA7668]|uniref:DUF4091 domain-containing protein n=1 Tax=Flavihumibacter sp. UBA7668 TaxID=1946542 RepID=UPI0025C3EC69|nr:DUF4091 domain-containing protein [Flavihumibacter sp. UBA7668]
MLFIQRLFVCLGIFIFLLSGCVQPGDAGFISTDIRLVNTQSQEKDSAVNPIFHDGQVIDVKNVYSNNHLKEKQKISAWRGERVHVQVAMKTTATKEKQLFSLSLSPLVNAKGDSISTRQIKIRSIGEVLTDEFHGGCGYRKDPAAFASSLVTDPLLNQSEIKADSVAFFWITIQVPEETKADSYTSTIKTSTGVNLLLQIDVKQRILPPPAQWSFDLDLWQHPAAIARVHNVPLWSDDHYAAMRPYYEELAAAGQKNITASIVHEPWGHQTFDDFPSLIKWTKTKAGTWTYDFTRFDQYVEFVMNCGIKERINCYSIIPWKMMVRYYDENLGRDTSVATEINTPAYAATWKPMLQAFTQHLKEKDWFSITTIAMDERPMPAMQKAIGLLKSIDPDWKIALAGDYHPEIEADIFDYCVASRWILDSAVLNKRKLSGKPTTVYTCCTEEYPNGFSFSPPAEHVYLGWYAQAKGFTGYLRWAYNSWTKSPLEDSRFTAWPAGDTYQVYPGPVSSIRFEKLIEGIQDFEKIRILKEEFVKNNDQEKLNKLNELMSEFEISDLSKNSARSIIEASKKKLMELE